MGAMEEALSALGDLIEFLENKSSEGKDYNSQDVKFIRDMIPHHEMAVEMAQKQIDKGKNANAIAFARDIKKTQSTEIATMRKWLTDRDLKEDSDGM